MSYIFYGLIPILLCVLPFLLLGDRRLVLAHCFGVEVSLSIPSQKNCYGIFGESKVMPGLNADAVCRSYSLVRVMLFMFFVYDVSTWMSAHLEKWGRQASDIENMERTSFCGVVKSVIQTRGGEWPVSEVAVKNELGKEEKYTFLNFTLLSVKSRIGRHLQQGDRFCIWHGYLGSERVVYKWKVEGRVISEERDFVDDYLSLPKFPFSGVVSLIMVSFILVGLREVPDE